MENVLAESIKDPHLVREAIKIQPSPLVHGPSRLGVIWSAKSACTKVVMWHFKLCGLLHAAAFYHQWPHRFRENVLPECAVYRRWINSDEILSEIKWHQFYRDPVKRTLSGYRHNVLHGYALNTIGRTIGRSIDPGSGFSLNEYLLYLERANVHGDCDIHIKSQLSPFSDQAVLINLDKTDLHDAINAIEASVGLPKTDRASFDRFNQHDAFHSARPAVGVMIDADQRFGPEAAKGDWPVVVDNIDEATLARIRRVYAKDIEFFQDRTISID